MTSKRILSWVVGSTLVLVFGRGASHLPAAETSDLSPDEQELARAAGLYREPQLEETHQWLMEILGDDYDPDVYGLEHLPNLENLSLSQKCAGDESLRFLAPLQNLKPSTFLTTTAKVGTSGAQDYIGCVI